MAGGDLFGVWSVDIETSRYGIERRARERAALASSEVAAMVSSARRSIGQSLRRVVERHAEEHARNVERWGL